ESELHHPWLVRQSDVLDRLAVARVAFSERVRTVVLVVEQVVGLHNPIDATAARRRCCGARCCRPDGDADDRRLHTWWRNAGLTRKSTTRSVESRTRRPRFR